jgi:Zn-dependent peptidase ImmA (M78 family)
MMKNFRGSIIAKKLLSDIGFDEITNLSMKLFVSALGATLVEEELKNSDGKIVRGKSKTLIKVNSQIPYDSKKRFTIAHEVGHFLMHDKIEVHNENSNTLNWFVNTESQLKKGLQEWEANDFASELLMPEQIFRNETQDKPFSPNLIKYLSERFKTSITSTVFRCLQLDIHPLLVVFISNGTVKYCDKTSNWPYWIKDINKLAPPDDSVAMEYINADYEFIYCGNEKAQLISKSTWCSLNKYDKDTDFFEYCIPTKQYKTIISVIWEK